MIVIGTLLWKWTNIRYRLYMKMIGRQSVEVLKSQSYQRGGWKSINLNFKLNFEHSLNFFKMSNTMKFLYTQYFEVHKIKNWNSKFLPAIYTISLKVRKYHSYLEKVLLINFIWIWKKLFEHLDFNVSSKLSL